jgi:hypothetical protein
MSKKLLLSIPMLLALIVAGSLAAQQNSPSPGQEPGRRGMGGAPPVLEIRPETWIFQPTVGVA